MHAPGAARHPLVDRGGKGQVRGTNALPTTHRLSLKTPINAPTPTRTTCRASPKPGREVLGKRHGWGKGLGGFSRSPPQPYPNPPPEARSPPSDVRADGKRIPRREGGSVGLGSSYRVSRPRVLPVALLPRPLPPDPPLIPHHPAPCFRTSPSRDIRKRGAG